MESVPILRHIFFGIITLTNEIERSHTNINFIKFNTEITLFSIVKRNDCVLCTLIIEKKITMTADKLTTFDVLIEIPRVETNTNMISK
jgi:hypothetical protein